MIPRGWTQTTIGQHADVLTGFAFKSAEYTENEQDVKLLRGDNIAPHKLRWRDVKRFPIARAAEVSRYELRAGDFVVAMDRTWLPSGVKIAEVSEADLPCLLVQRVARLRAKASLHQELMRQFFSGHSFDQYVQSVQTETAVPHISPSDLRDYPIKLPPLPEQRRIAEILSTWDRAIGTVEALIANTRAQSKALMQSLLTGKKRLPGFSGPWKHQQVSEISTRINRRNDGTQLPVLTISSTSGFVRQDQKYSRFMAGKSVENYIMLQKGEFAYNKGNSKTYEFGCVFDLDEFECGLVPHVYVCFKLKDGYSHRFYKALFGADYLAPQLGRLVNTGIRNNGLLNITPAQFLSTSVPVPPADEQDRIAAVMECASGEVRALQAQLAALRQEKSALMQQLLTGKRRVKAPDSEVAHA